MELATTKMGNNSSNASSRFSIYISNHLSQLSCNILLDADAMVMLMMRTRGKLTGKLGTYIARYLVVVVTTNPRILSTTRKETIVQIKKKAVIILLSAR